MKDNYYFDNAATSFPKPESVYRFMDEFARTSAVNPGRAGHSLAIEAEMMVQQTRQMLAAFFGFTGPYQRVVFTQNVTDSLNLALHGLVKSGDHVVASVSEHNSVLRPLNHMIRDGAVEVTYVGVDTAGYINPEDVRKAIKENTRLVVINHGSNVTGACQDVSAIGAIAHAHDAVLLVDTAQTAGVIDIDMARDNIDLLAFTGHKGLFGPMGTGGLVVGESIDLAPTRVGGTGMDSIDPYQPLDYPYRLEAGTIAVQGIAGLHAAQKWFAAMGKELQIGGAAKNHRELSTLAVEKIAQQELAHTQRLIEVLNSQKGVRVLGPVRADQPRVATLSFTVEGMSSMTVAEMLDADYHICVRAGLHCAPMMHQSFKTLDSEGAVRVSPGFFTTDEDIDHLIGALEEISR